MKRRTEGNGEAFSCPFVSNIKWQIHLICVSVIARGRCLEVIFSHSEYGAIIPKTSQFRKLFRLLEKAIKVRFPLARRLCI